MADTCSVETFGNIVRKACGTATDVREYASLFKPFGLNKSEFKKLVGGFRRDQRLLDAEIKEAAYCSQYHIFEDVSPVEAALMGGAQFRKNPNVEGEFYVTLDDGTEVTCAGTPDTDLKDRDGEPCATALKDPITLECVDPSDVVRLSDGQCYSRKSMRQWAAHDAEEKEDEKDGKTKQKKRRKSLPLTQQNLTDDDRDVLASEPAPHHEMECPEYDADRKCVVDVLDATAPCIPKNEVIGIHKDGGEALSDGHCYRQSSLRKEIESGRMRSPATRKRFTEKDLEIIKQPLRVSEAAILKKLMESMNSSLVGKWMDFMDEQKKNAKATSDTGAMFTIEEPVLIDKKCPRLEGLNLTKFKDNSVEGYVTSIHLRGKKPAYTVFVVEGSQVVRGVKEKYLSADSFARRTYKKVKKAFKAISEMGLVKVGLGIAGTAGSFLKNIGKKIVSGTMSIAAVLSKPILYLGRRMWRFMVYLGDMIIKSPKQGIMILYIAKGLMKQLCRQLVMHFHKVVSGVSGAVEYATGSVASISGLGFTRTVGEGVSNALTGEDTSQPVSGKLRYSEREAKMGDTFGYAVGDFLSEFGNISQAAVPTVMNKLLHGDKFDTLWEKGTGLLVKGVESLPGGPFLGGICEMFMGGAKEIVQFNADVIMYQRNILTGATLFIQTIQEFFKITRGCSPVEITNCNAIEMKDSCNAFSFATDKYQKAGTQCLWDDKVAERNAETGEKTPPCRARKPGELSASEKKEKIQDIKKLVSDDFKCPDPGCIDDAELVRKAAAVKLGTDLIKRGEELKEIMRNVVKERELTEDDVDNLVLYTAWRKQVDDKIHEKCDAPVTTKKEKERCEEKGCYPNEVTEQCDPPLSESEQNREQDYVNDVNAWAQKIIATHTDGKFYDLYDKIFATVINPYDTLEGRFMSKPTNSLPKFAWFSDKKRGAGMSRYSGKTPFADVFPRCGKDREQRPARKGYSQTTRRLH